MPEDYNASDPSVHSLQQEQRTMIDRMGDGTASAIGVATDLAENGSKALNAVADGAEQTLPYIASALRHSVGAIIKTGRNLFFGAPPDR